MDEDSEEDILTDADCINEISKFAVRAYLTRQKTNELITILRRAGHNLPNDY